MKLSVSEAAKRAGVSVRTLLMKRRRLDDMLRLVDETIGGIAMYDERPKPTQADWEAVKEQYAREVAERWAAV